MALYGRKPAARAEVSQRQMAEQLKDCSTYQLVFELVARIRETNGMEFCSTRQLLIIGRACLEDLSRRAMRKAGGTDV